MKFESPLRYPGGKAPLAPLLAKTIELNGLSGCTYFEPFTGGAGAALRLLRDGVVSELHLNDLDPHIFSFWTAVLHESERFAEAILSVSLSIEEWRNQQQICATTNLTKPFELGFATFYLNRCNRSGIIHGAAPIGGYAQDGVWRMNARFYKETLAKRVLALGKYQDQIQVTNMDALDFLVQYLPRGYERSRVFTYLDPPYYENGNRLYMNFYNDRNHRELADYLQKQSDLKWIMSYDDTDFIRSLYATCNISHLSLEYSLQKRREERELLISPSQVLKPATDGEQIHGIIPQGTKA